MMNTCIWIYCIIGFLLGTIAWQKQRKDTEKSFEKAGMPFVANLLFCVLAITAVTIVWPYLIFSFGSKKKDKEQNQDP